MAVTAAPMTSLKDTGRIIRSVADEVAFIGPGQIPFLTYVTGQKLELNGKSKVVPRFDTLPKSGGVRSTTFEWYEQALVPVSLTSSGNLTNSATTITITPAINALHLVVGTIIEIDDEQMRVTAAGDGTAGTATISRGWAGTTAAAHTSAANDVKIISRAVVEGATVDYDPFLPPDQYYNEWQETYESFQKTSFDKAISRYGDAKNWKEEAISAALRRAVLKLERAAVYASRVTATATTPRQFGGMRYFTSATTNLSAATLTKAHINTVMRTAYDAGGVDNCPDTILTNSYGKVTLSNVYGNGYVTVYRQEDETTAGYVVDEIMTDFGQVKIIMSPYVNQNSKELWFFRKDTIGIGPLKNNGEDLSFKAYDLPSSALSEGGYVHGVYTMCFRRPTSRALLSNFVTP